MDNFKSIQAKLKQFISKYYINELLKGAILFFAIGLLYFMFTLFIEYILWLNPTIRTILFWLFVLVEFALFIKFIGIPLAKLFKLQKGIDNLDASKIIGRYFPEVNDKLLNVLQLHQEESQSELLLAGIEQKSIELNPIPFKLAVNFKKNILYLKYATIPIAIILFVFITGNSNLFSDSYKRVVDYKTAYQPPAPFQFFIVNKNLNAIENKDYRLMVKTIGMVIPENVSVVYNNETYFLQQREIGEFEYVFSQPKTDIKFQLSANDIISKPYTLNIIEVPLLLSFEMVLDYPNYTKKKDIVLKSTGNAIVPEGTKVVWKLKTKSTKNVQLYSKDTISFSSSKEGVFKTSKRVYNNLSYSISTSNSKLTNYENLAFKIGVVKDEYPTIDLQTQTDSLDLQTLYFYGQVSDDYGLSKLQLVYYKTGDEDNKRYKNISLANSNISEFIGTFPNDLDVEEGISYELYFQVIDNDEVNLYKKTKSSVFTFRKHTQDEEDKRKLEDQSKTIQDINKSLKRFNEQEQQLEELSKTQKEKSSLNFNDKKKLESFLKRQKQQDEMMKNFNKKLKYNLESFQKENPKEDVFKEDLKKRLQENEEQLKKDEKLLEELRKLQEQINKEELTQKLEELAKQNKNKKRSLEQLLELTKRFYVEKKLEKLKEDLSKLAIDQEKLSNQTKENNTAEKQKELNKDFKDFKKELDQLQKDSKALKKTIKIPQDKLEENEIKKEQEKATEQLKKKDANKEENQNLKNAQKSQKKAAKKMMQMSQNMQQSIQGGGRNQMQEDADMLRQILDNLVLFSFHQEALMERFKTIGVDNNKYAFYLRKQNNLKEHFEHIDDSLFALSLRNPKISESISKEITEVFYNIDKALNQFAENQLYQGISNQQFTITAANNLASMLSDILDNIQENISISISSGEQGDMQLPNIIMSQEQLNKMMQEGIKKSEKGKPQKDHDKSKQERQQSGNNGFSEDVNGELFNIYKQQQELRKALEQELLKNKKRIGNAAKKLLKKMEDVELDLLNKGFTNQTLQKMMELQHQLLKLDNAIFQQKQDNKRESNSNSNQFNNTTNNQIPTAKQYFKTTEILNRQTLPLQQVYKKKVQEYFKKDND